jgi:hypothetical protein
MHGRFSVTTVFRVSAGTRTNGRAQSMKIARLAFLVAGLLGGPAAFGAQSSFNSYGGLAQPELVPYGQPLQVPPDGCVWGNLVYSSGAVIAQCHPFSTYFQCERGTWTIIPPGDAIFGRRAPEKPGSAPQRSP